MNQLKWNYYRIFLILFRILILAQSLHFILNGKYVSALYSIFTLFITFIINFIYSFTKLYPSTFIKFLVQFFIFISMFLGHSNNMYSIVPRYDDILHIFSGLIIGFFAYLILERFNINEKIHNSKYFAVVFIILFGTSLSGIWEMFEFSMDSLFSLTSQGGSLDDTMKDMINGSIFPVALSLLYLLNPSIFNSIKNP